MLKQVHCVHNYNSVNHNIVDSINSLETNLDGFDVSLDMLITATLFK